METKRGYEVNRKRHLKESTSQEQWKIWHEWHQESGESGEKEDGRHEAQFEAAAGEVLGEDVAG